MSTDVYYVIHALASFMILIFSSSTFYNLINVLKEKLKIHGYAVNVLVMLIGVLWAAANAWVTETYDPTAPKLFFYNSLTTFLVFLEIFYTKAKILSGLGVETNAHGADEEE